MRSATARSLIALIALAVTTPAPGLGAPEGLIRPASCVIDAAAAAPGACTPVAHLAGSAFLTITPDGRNLYATARDAGAVVAFARDPASGRLTPIPGPGGCVSSQAATAECASFPALGGASAIVASADGRHLYVASRNPGAVVWLRRAPDGTIRAAGCRQDAAALPVGCQAADQIGDAQGIALSPDGRHVYVTGFAYGSVAVFTRDQATGDLAPASCVVRAGAAQPRSCAPVEGLAGAGMVAMSPDGRSVYVPARDDDALVTFSRDPASGSLTPLGCLSGNVAVLPRCTELPGLDYPQNAVVTGDGGSVYVASTDTHAVFALRRDPASGRLSRPEGLDGCVTDAGSGIKPCASVLALTLPFGLALGPGDRSLFVGAFGEDSVVPLQRAADGKLSPLGLCASGEQPDCRALTNIDRAGYAAASPDRRYLYVNSPTSGSVTVFAVSGDPGRVGIRARSVGFRDGRAGVSLACPPGQPQGCVGSLTLWVTGGAGAPSRLTAPVPFALPAGRTARVPVRALRAVGRPGFARVEATLREPYGQTRAFSRVVPVRG